MDEELLKDICYQVDTNDGKEHRGFFKKITYAFNKPQLKFEDFRHKPFYINPSYLVTAHQSEATDEELMIYNNKETMEY